MGSLFSTPDIPPPPPPPVPKPTPPMPDMQSPDVLEAGKRNQAAIMARSGRRSTILSQGSDSGPYTQTTLGGGN